MGTTLDKPKKQSSEQWDIVNSFLVLEKGINSENSEQKIQHSMALDSISITVIFVVTVLLTLAVLTIFQCCLQWRLSQMHQHAPRDVPMGDIEENKDRTNNQPHLLLQDERIAEKEDI